ncbi:MAG TPA: [FeFe] hydrogenase H-cluster radical SAM maturase HydG [Deltaproteobacteria bacterium]|nr:[FeFe] hydrogenase H-cluster radical SAM maturase HydG [Deltaproteobacteria bacterium]
MTTRWPAMFAIDEERIHSIIEGAEGAEAGTVRAVLAKAAGGRGLALEEAALLLCAEDEALIAEITAAADELKRRVFGTRVVLFAPLYLSNRCSNACLYCGFRSPNRALGRKALTPEQAAAEAAALAAMGLRRVLLVTGEDGRSDTDYIIRCIRAIYEKTEVRIVHVNAAPMEADDFRALKAAGAGVYQCFQETYHEPTYRRMHPRGAKSDYRRRLHAMDRAAEAGFDDLGIGALLGLYDHRFDVLAAIAHSRHLHDRYGAHAHTISVPRLNAARGAPLREAPSPVSDRDLEKITAVYRLSVPTAGVVVSTRESPRLRSRLLRCGASQISAASRTDPGGYTAGDDTTLSQFSTRDDRPLHEVIASVAADGCLPSLCTSCYRAGRTGERFGEMTGSGAMKEFCRANAILTLKEYVVEHGTNGEGHLLEKTLREGLDGMGEGPFKEELLRRLEEIEAGKRDLYF